MHTMTKSYSQHHWKVYLTYQYVVSLVPDKFDTQYQEILQKEKKTLAWYKGCQ